jgi:hypothetical protein
MQRTVGGFAVTFFKSTTTFLNWNVYGDFITNNLLRMSFNTLTNVQITFANTTGAPTSRSLSAPLNAFGNIPPFFYFNAAGITFTLTGDWQGGQGNTNFSGGNLVCGNFYYYTGAFYIANTGSAKNFTFNGTGGVRGQGRTDGGSGWSVFGNDSFSGLTVTGTPNFQYYRTTSFTSTCTFGGSYGDQPAQRGLTPLKFVATSAGTAFGLVFNTGLIYNGGVDMSGWIRGQYPITTSSLTMYCSGNTNLGANMMQAGQTVRLQPPDNTTITFSGTTIQNMVYNTAQANGRSFLNGTVQLSANTDFAGASFFSIERCFLNLGGFTLNQQRFQTSNHSNLFACGVTGTGTIVIRASEVTGTNLFFIDYASVFTFSTGVTITAANSGTNNGWVYGASSPPSPTNTNTPNITFTGSAVNNYLYNAWRNVNLSGVTSGGFQWFSNGGGAPRVMGDLTLSSTAGITLAGNLGINGGGTQTITGNGRTVSANITVDGAGTVNFASGWVSTGNFVHTNGTINFGAGTTFTLAVFTSSGATARTVNLNSATLNMNGTFDVAAGGITFTGTSATINMNAAGTFAGGSRSYGTVRLGTTGNVVVSGANTISTLNINANGTLTLPASTTTTVTNFTTTNSAGQATLQSSSAGTQATLSKSTGTVNVSNLRIQDSNATGGATFIAYTINNNTNLGNNTNWIFSSYTPSNQFFPFS